MRVLLIGDIVGRPGLEMVCRSLGMLREREQLDLVMANAENIEEGSGLTKAQFRRLRQAGVDGVTLGDHIYRKREIMEVLEADEPIVKPANLPREAPGREFMVLTAKDGSRLAVMSLLGRVFMKPVDCPFHAADRVLAELPQDVQGIVVDFHAEATSDKQLLGRYLDGRVSAVLGTHTHVATADETIFPQGTAFQCDVGMTGPHDGIIGRRYDRVLETTYSMRPTTFLVASGDVRLCGTIVEIDSTTGKATAIRRLVVRESELSSDAG